MPVYGMNDGEGRERSRNRGGIVRPVESLLAPLSTQLRSQSSQFRKLRLHNPAEFRRDFAGVRAESARTGYPITCMLSATFLAMYGEWTMTHLPAPAAPAPALPPQTGPTNQHQVSDCPAMQKQFMANRHINAACHHRQAPTVMVREKNGERKKKDPARQLCASGTLFCFTNHQSLTAALSASSASAH